MKTITNKLKKTVGACLSFAILISGMGALSACGNSTALRYELNEDKQSYSVKGIGTSSLYGTPSAKKITIPSTRFGKPVTGICEWGFEYYQELQSITIPDSVTTIGEGAFYDCRSLEKVTLPQSLTDFNGRVFMSCSTLTELSLSADCATFTCEGGVLYSKDLSVLVCYPPAKTGDFTLPNGVEKIGKWAFLGANVTSVVLPDTMTEIGVSAFESSALQKITLGEGLKIIGAYAFQRSQLKEIAIGAGVENIGENAFLESKALEMIEVAEDNPAYCSIDGNLYSKDGSVLLQYAAGKANTSFTLPSETETVEKYAFVGAENLVTVDLSGGTKIGYGAFLGCSALKNIDLGDRLTSIGELAFSDCAIENLTIPASVEYIGSGISHHCPLTSVVFEDPEGWTAVKEQGIAKSVPISSSTLAAPALACAALQEYWAYEWIKS